MKSDVDHSRTLVLGATGSFGGAVARELLRRGRPVRILARHPERAAALVREFPAVEVRNGDAQNAGHVAWAAEDCATIVHAINYPYHQWLANMEAVTANIIAAARSQSATVVFPGNVYALGRRGGHVNEAVPNAPVSVKGALRDRIEQELREAADGGIQVLVVRAGDYFGPTVRNGLVDPIFGNAAAAKPMRVFGNLEKRHQWAYVPDLARATVDLLDMRRMLRRYELVNFEGFVVPKQIDFCHLVARGAGHAKLGISKTSWATLRLAGLFDPIVRELLELRYLWDESLILDGSKLKQLLPEFETSSLEDAVRATVASYR
ncbi:MAG: NAD-dependent epimerase/dehydratase family protein [Thermoanaerobaculia bacterium]